MAPTPRTRNPGPELPDNDYERPDPPRTASHDFTLQIVVDLQRSHGSLTKSIELLSKAIEKQSERLSKIDDLRVDLKEMSTKLDRACLDIDKARAKIDKVHSWVVGASAVIFFVVAIAQVAVRLWPTK
jgi:tRNA A58 N-methylase Trm61